MSFYTMVKSTFRNVVPRSWQDSLWANRQRPLNKALIKVKLSLEKTASNHDDIYDEKYFRDLDGDTARSAGTMADTIVREFNPKTAIDAGCGTGVLLAALRERGVDVRGLEYATAAIEFCKKRGLDVVQFDLEK